MTVIVGAGVGTGVGAKVAVGTGSACSGAAVPPQADTNRATDMTSNEMWSFTISSLVQGGLAIPSLTTALIQTGPVLDGFYRTSVKLANDATVWTWG